jgi:hypothetical protein
VEIPPPAPGPVIHIVEPEVYETTAAVAEPKPVAVQPSIPVLEQTATMLLAGFFGTMLLISLSVGMVAGGRWHKRRLARARS